MSDLIKIESLTIWQSEKLASIKDIFAPTLTNLEFENFVELGKSLGLNPFNREIWAVKYQEKCSIFVGRDGYRKVAQQTKEYDGMISDAIYSNDSFEVVDSKPKHSYQLKDRGFLVGAYCIVFRKNIQAPYFKFVELKEYLGVSPLWKSKPATMIIKVAEAQALRSSFQSVFKGTYDESEIESFEQEELKEPITLQKSDDPLKNVRSKNIIELYNYAYELATLKNGDVFDEIAEKSKKGDWFISKEMFLDLENQLKTDTKGLWLKAIDYTTSQLAKALQDKKGA